MSTMDRKDAFYRELAQSVLAEMPPEARFGQEDALLLTQHKEALLGLEEELVKAFYDTLFGHPPTASVFKEGERPAREQMLRSWWRRTVEGPINDEYWAWQAYVGLLHVRRGVTNPMMLGQVNLVSELVHQRLGHLEGGALAAAVGRLMVTIGAIIVQGYEGVYWKAVEHMTGQSLGLIKRNVQLAVEEWMG